jgi:Ca2+-binding EF-hand superfamily protein
MKINFDEMNTSKTGVVTLDEYLKANETNSFLKKFSVNLFKFIDKDGKGFTFRKFLKRIVPGATKEHLEIMEGWVASEDLLKQRAQKNYKESADIGTNEMHKTRQALSTRQIKDVIQMFVMIDKAGKGYLVLPELIEAYKAFTSEKSVTAQFQKSNKAKDGKLLLPEYIEMMFPPELYVSEIVMKNFVIPFYNSIKK